ncbi:Protein of unknown function DUF2087 [Desulfovibrio sp. X2]|uniref:DUF2087 domain-containing protein n=1 Tax=Desulfovibrio sp. X2 TaxID=941449 RepID=UPI000358C1A3|nr:DUF2087 domain-containing protein [Desulfovibrio sp. X2]EPR43963.1 Protein of unknown function DUF2087 [Desulfovibrio sp. X2]
MPRTPLPYFVGDISALARSLKGQLAARETTPSHLELLNMLARSAGCRNFQHFRAQTAPAVPGAPADAGPEAAAPAVDPARLRRLLRFFDAEGRLVRWPGKHGQRAACLWVLWAALPARRVLTEPEIDGCLKSGHLFGDHVLLRRWLCDLGLVERTPDCREYRRIERRPPQEALALIGSVRSRSAPAA